MPNEDLPAEDRPRPTMAAIAEACGVSVATVSRSLRGSQLISDVTRQKVRSTAEKLGYRPDPLVAKLMVQVRRKPGVRTGTTLGLLVSSGIPANWKNSDIYNKWIEGARARADALGYGLDVLDPDAPGRTPAKLAEILRARGIPGVLIAPTVRPREDLLPPLSGLAMTTIGFELGSLPLHRASTHFAQGVRLALTTLRERGYRRVGLAVTRSLCELTGFGWLSAYNTPGLAGEGLEGVPAYVQEKMLARSIRAWIEKHQPEVILTGQSVVIEALEESGLAVPDDVHLLHLNWSEHRPQYAGVDQDHARVARAAIDLLVSQIHFNRTGLPEHPQTVLIEGTWREGPSLPGADFS
ncbi:MAG: LacI family DNA-binding transcriptional regulator [Opitutales bacterium]